MNWKHWFYGLAAAFIGGGATAGSSWMGIAMAREMGFEVPQLKFTAMAIVFLSGALSNVFAYLKQSPLPAQEATETISLKRTITKLLIFLLLPSFLFTGCATTRLSVADAIQSKSVQADAKFALSVVAKTAPFLVKDEIDRRAIKAQLLSWGNAVNKLLSTGKNISTDDLQGIFNTFDSSLDAKKFSESFGSLTGPINEYLNDISPTKDVETIRAWAVVFAQAAIAGGS